MGRCHKESIFDLAPFDTRSFRTCGRRQQYDPLNGLLELLSWSEELCSRPLLVHGAAMDQQVRPNSETLHVLISSHRRTYAAHVRSSQVSGCVNFTASAESDAS